MEKFIYEAPAVLMTEFEAEGILCDSKAGGTLNVKPWEDGDFGWDE